MNNIRVFEPADFADHDAAVLTTNHLGADFAGDAAKDAQYLANSSGLLVVAQDRPGTGDCPPAPSYQTPEETVKRWAGNFESTLSVLGVGRMYAVGRSAGSLILLQATAERALPISAVAAVESIGWVDLSRNQGRMRYAKYQFGSERQRRQREAQKLYLAPAANQPAESLTTRLAGVGSGAVRAASVGKRQIRDILHSQDAWRSNLAHSSALSITLHQPEVPLLLTFAEQPLAAPRTELKANLDRLVELRKKHRAHAHWAPVVYTFLKGATHGSFDDPAKYGAQLQRLLDMVSEQD